MAQRTIVTSVSEKVRPLLFAYDTAKKMLDKLDAVFDHNQEGIAGHISKLEYLVNQIRTLGEMLLGEMLMVKILNTLPPEFAHFHSVWNSTPQGEKKFNNLMARLLIEEERLKNKRTEQNTENKEENTALPNHRKDDRFQKNENWRNNIS